MTSKLNPVSSLEQSFRSPQSSVGVAIYYPTDNAVDAIVFTREQFLLSYHLIRFGYFDKEVIDNLNYIFYRTRHVNHRWFYSCIGSRNYPISIYDQKKDGRKIIYYMNKKFVTWLLEEVAKYFEFENLLAIPEKKILHSLQANRHVGKKPSTIHSHELGVRRFVSRIIKHLTDRLPDMPYDDITLHVTFPVNRRVNSLLPDAAIHFMGKDYYFEYDRNTESHSKVFSKLIGYFGDAYYQNSSVFFIFDELGTPQDNKFHRRPKYFMDNMVSIKYGYTDKTYFEMMEANKVQTFISPSVNSVSQIAHAIMLELNLLPSLKSELSEKYIRGLPYDFNAFIEVEELEEFDGMIEVRDHDYDVLQFPIIRIPYVWAGLPLKLSEWYDNYSQRYSHIGLIFDADIKGQFYPVPHEDFFISLFL